MVEVLVVDNEQEIRNNIAEGLGIYLGSTINVDTASDGQDALDMFQKKHYNVIISDGNMPRMSGPELARNILSSNSDILFIGITAKLITKVMFAEAGVASDHIFIKPMSIASLAKIVKDELSLA